MMYWTNPSKTNTLGESGVNYDLITQRVTPLNDLTKSTTLSNHLTVIILIILSIPKYTSLYTQI